MRKLLLVLGFVFVLPVLAFSEEITLKMLVWEGYAPQEMQDKFSELVKEKYGVDVTFEVSFVGGNDDFIPALRGKKADIISPSHIVPKDNRFNLITMNLNLLNMNLILPLDLDLIPNYENLMPALKKADYATQDGDVFAVPHVRGPYGLAYNTTIIKEEPKSWNILWDPKYRKNYVLGGIDQYEHNVSLTALAMGIPPEKIYDYRSLNTPRFQEKLSQLAANAHSFWEGVDDAQTLKGHALAVVWGFSLPELETMGEKWKIAEPTEGTTGWVDNFMISSALAGKPKKRLIAHEWLNFVLSDDYQLYNVHGLASAPVTVTVKNSLTTEEIKRFHLDDPGHFEKNRLLWKVLDQNDRKGLKSLWTNAMSGRM
jgi:spermidine/putrescine-binding protein